MLLLLCLMSPPLAAEETCAIRALRLVASSPDTVRFQVEYFIPPSYTNPCFIGAYAPNATTPDAHFRYDPAGALAIGVPKGERPFSDDVSFSVTYAGPQTITTKTVEVIIYEKESILCSQIFPVEKCWEPHGAPPTGLRIERSLLARPEEAAADLDHDGLIDAMENRLAEVSRPYLRFDSAERSRAGFEPVTLFQVRPLDLSAFGDLRVAITWMFLFRQDGGYGAASRCRGAHAGDIETAHYELSSHDGGATWDIIAIQLSDKPELAWRTQGSGLETYGGHPVLAVAAGTHHLYFSNAYDHRDSPYSRWGCIEEVNARGALVMPDLKPLGDSAWGNVGEPESHPSPPFIASLDRIYPGQSAWGDQPFFSSAAGRIAQQWTTAPWKGRLAPGYRLQAYGSPDLFVRHRRYLGELTRLYSSIEKQSATFRIVPGLADPALVSFEAVDYPGFYLCAQDARMKLMKRTDNDLFRQDATFRLVPGLADKNAASFESSHTPGAFIRQREAHLFLESGDNATFRTDATFRIITP